MQRGQIYRKNGAWLLRYYDLTVNGKIRRAVKLASIQDKLTKDDLRILAEKHLGPLNARQVQPESSLPVKDFIKNHYLPHCKAELRPSTYTDYSTVYNTYLKD